MSAENVSGASSGFAWPNGARLALSIVVNVEEGAEHNIRDGDPGPEPVDELGAVPHKPIRSHGNESNYQYGVQAGAPRVLRLLAAHRIEATFTAASLALLRAPDLARQIVDAGHEVCCHGYRWTHQFRMNESTEREFIREGLRAIEKVCGKRPVGWLSRYLHTDITRALLAEEGLLYHMDDYSDDFPYWDLVRLPDRPARPIVVLPYAIDSNDMKFWIAPSLTTRDWLQYAKDTFDWLLEESRSHGARMMSLGLHLRIIGRPGRIGALAAFLDYVAGRPDVWITSREKIARAFAADHPAPLA